MRESRLLVDIADMFLLRISLILEDLISMEGSFHSLALLCEKHFFGGMINRYWYCKVLSCLNQIT